MKIAVIGYSGSGKSTLAAALGKEYGADVLHLDSVHFLPRWKERPDEEKRRVVEAFLDSHDSWVIDGNYTKLFYERRTEEADRIVMMLFGRFACLYRVTKRYKKYKNSTRPDMAEGCPEKLDAEFVKWVLWKGRSKKARERYKNLAKRYPDKVTVLKNQRQLDAFMRENCQKNGGRHV